MRDLLVKSGDANAVFVDKEEGGQTEACAEQYCSRKSRCAAHRGKREWVRAGACRENAAVK